MHTLKELQEAYDVLCQKILPTTQSHRFLSERTDDGAPHVELHENEIHIVSTERGLELSRKIFTSKDEFLYQMIADLTFWMAVEFEFKNRVEGRDCRRIIFAKQLDLIRKCGDNFATRLEIEHAKTLMENPFHDF